MKVDDLPEGEEVFIDANIFLFHVLDELRYGEASTQFLEKIERREIKAVTNVIVLNPSFPLKNQNRYSAAPCPLNFG